MLTLFVSTTIAVAAQLGPTEQPTPGTARALYGICAAKEDDATLQMTMSQVCEAYIQGYIEGFQTMVDAVNTTHDASLDWSGDGCPIGEVLPSQRARVFVAWVEANPQMEHMPAGLALLSAFLDAWPCES